MPILSNPRQERFAQELAKGKRVDEASEIAGIEAKLVSLIYGVSISIEAENARS